MRKLILVAIAAAILAVPTIAVASTGRTAAAKGTTAKVCVRKTKTGFKARLTAKKCKRGEKSLKVHLPAGATGPQGPAGAPGPAGSFVVKDAGGNPFGTLVAYDGRLDWVMLSNGIIEPFDAWTGQIQDQQPFVYASTDCSGQGYTFAQSAQSPFAPVGADTTLPNSGGSPGSTLYVPSGPQQTITERSFGIPGNCQTTGGFPAQVYAAAPTSFVQPGNPVGPLTVARQQ